MEREKSPSKLTTSTGLEVGKLPETKTGIKLKQKLLQEESVQNVRSVRKVQQLSLEEKSIAHSSYELFNSIDIANGNTQ